MVDSLMQMRKFIEIGADFARAEALTTWCSKPWAAAQLQKDRG
jgi:hypothetical protein